MIHADIKIQRRYSLTIPKEIRASVPIKEGQTLHIYTEGKRIIIEPYFEDPFETIDNIAGDIIYDRAARKKAEEWRLKQAKSRVSFS